MELKRILLVTIVCLLAEVAAQSNAKKVYLQSQFRKHNRCMGGNLLKIHIDAACQASNGPCKAKCDGTSTRDVKTIGCGNVPTTRIVGGQEAGRGYWPWQALLQSARSGSQFCGGTLVHPQWVLTTSHCVERSKPKDIIVRMGAHYRVESSSTSSTEQKFKITKIIMHNSYNKPMQMSHDAALLKLERPAILDEYTGLACLPVSDPNEGKQCVITGWGTLSSGGSQPAKLQVAHVPIVRQADCKTAYKNEIHDSMLCAGYPEGGKDACQGDSGGPMVCPGSDGKYSVHGVTSWGYGCAAPKKYGVYARVAYLTKWVNTQINNN